MNRFAYPPQKSFAEKPAGIALIAMAAAAVGALTAMLVTPKRGAELRGSMADKFHSVTNQAAEKSEDVKGAAKSAASSVASNANDVVATAADKAKDVTDKASKRADQAADTVKEKSDEVETRTHRRINR